jgi:hypothetical protein
MPRLVIKGKKEYIDRMYNYKNLLYIFLVIPEIPRYIVEFISMVKVSPDGESI